MSPIAQVIVLTLRAQALEAGSRLSSPAAHSQAVIAGFLASRMEEGFVATSTKEIAAYCRQSPRNVRRHLRALTLAGKITRVNLAGVAVVV